MALVTHGTTLAGFKAIMAGNGKSLEHTPWTVSDNDNQMYFYHVEDVAEDYGNDDGDFQYAANLSAEAAQLQYAARGEGGRVVVMVCDIPDELLEEDGSCPNMPHARMISCGDFDPEWIKVIQVADFDQWDCVGVLSCVWDNDMFNKAEVPEKLARLVEATSGQGCFYEDVYNYDLETVEVQEFIQQNA